MLEENARCAQLQCSGRFLRAHAGSDHEYPARISGLAGRRYESVSMPVPQVKIEKHHVNIRAAEYFDALGCSAALGDHIEVRLRCQKAGQAFPKEGVIVHQ